MSVIEGYLNKLHRRGYCISPWWSYCECIIFKQTIYAQALKFHYQMCVVLLLTAGDSYILLCTLFSSYLFNNFHSSYFLLYFQIFCGWAFLQRPALLAKYWICCNKFPLTLWKLNSVGTPSYSLGPIKLFISFIHFFYIQPNLSISLCDPTKISFIQYGPTRHQFINLCCNNLSWVWLRQL